jgi:hypothetical protein
MLSVQITIFIKRFNGGYCPLYCLKILLYQCCNNKGYPVAECTEEEMHMSQHLHIKICKKTLTIKILLSCYCTDQLNLILCDSFVNFINACLQKDQSGILSLQEKKGTKRKA